MRQGIFHVFRRISTSFPSAAKATNFLSKASENVAAPLNNATPKSFRANEQIKRAEILRRGFDKYSIVLLSVPIVTFGLGCWQIQRRHQKHARINLIKTNIKQEPIELPQDLRTLENMEYTPVRVVGEFCHDEEIIIQPRHRHDVFKTADGVETDPLHRVNEVGAHVITPFRVAGKNYKILVQRGWVPLDRIEASKRSEGQVKGQVELVGIVRANEKRPKFVPENDPLEGHWTYRDVEVMGRIRNAAPVYLEATTDSNVPGGPIGGQTMVRLRDDHMSYIVTWFSLSVITSWLWYRQFLKPFLRLH